MRLGRPRTLLGLILMGLALVTLPLLFAIGNAALKLGQLAGQSETVVSQSALATLENQRVVNYLTDMERNALQYLVLQDTDLLALYEEDQVGLEQTLQTLARLPRDPNVDVRLAELRVTSEQVLETLRGDVSTDDQQAIVAGFRSMTAIARRIAETMRLTINEDLNQLQQQTNDAQRTLGWQAAALVPGTLALVAFFLLLVGRPMRQIDRAIRELGKGDFSHSIAVTGPSDIETLGRQLEWLRHRLKESTEEKNKFLRHMSHELKTPLANIREGTELLMDGSVGTLDHQQQEVTGILRDNGVKLQKLIENLLTFSAWQTKTASLELSEVDLKPLVFSAISQHRLTISNRKIKLQLAISPIRVEADEGKLRLVLENLISNAVRFTPSNGTIHVGARMQDTALIIDVADNGPGIATEDAERIFEAFYQGRRLQGGPVGGTGIGLSVVAECVQLHRGTVRLVHGEWSGAHFRVQLPIRPAKRKPVLVAHG